MRELKNKKKEIHDHRRDLRSDLARPRRISPEDKIRRLERIERNDSTRHLKDYNLNRARRLEDCEIRTNAKGFERRNRGQGLDRATERRVKLEKIKQDRKYRRDH